MRLQKRLVRSVYVTPETVGDVLLRFVGHDAVKALVGGGTLQRPEMADKRTDFDVVEIGDVDG